MPTLIPLTAHALRTLNSQPPPKHPRTCCAPACAVRLASVSSAASAAPCASWMLQILCYEQQWYNQQWRVMISSDTTYEAVKLAGPASPPLRVRLRAHMPTCPHAHQITPASATVPCAPSHLHPHPFARPHAHLITSASSLRQPSSAPAPAPALTPTRTCAHTRPPTRARTRT